MAYAGFLHDAEKEYAEAVLTAALVDGDALPGHRDLRVEAPAWLNGLAEAASELRRHLLDRLRDGRGRAWPSGCSPAMEDVYELLVARRLPRRRHRRACAAPPTPFGPCWSGPGAT